MREKIRSSVPLSAIPSEENKFSKILNDYSRITLASNTFFLPPATSDVRYHIITTGPPTCFRPHRLSPAMLAIAKKEMYLLLQLGICRPSSSPWASPLHMVPKEGEAWRVVGDYRALNNITTPDSYPPPHIHDFSLTFTDC